jgi:hypothetical protein
MALSIKVDSLTKGSDDKGKAVYHAYVMVLDGTDIIAKVQVDHDPSAETLPQLKERVRGLLKPEVQSHLERVQTKEDFQTLLGTLDPNNL